MNEKGKVALGSIAASAGLTAAKAVVGLLTGSLAILSEAGHSLIDLSATVLTYFAVRLSGKPADKEHQYGHGKVESVTALAETALLVPAHRRRDLGGGAAADRRAGPCRRGNRRRVRHHRRFDRGRFFSRAHAAPRRQGDIERGARSRRAAFRLRHVVVGRGADRSWRRCAWLFVGRCHGGDRRCGFHLHRRLAARPAHHRHADRYRAGRRQRTRRGDRAPGARRRRRRAGAGAAGRARCCSSISASASAARCRSIASPPSRIG